MECVIYKRDVNGQIIFLNEVNNVLGYTINLDKAYKLGNGKKIKDLVSDKYEDNFGLNDYDTDIYIAKIEKVDGKEKLASTLLVKTISLVETKYGFKFYYDRTDNTDEEDFEYSLNDINLDKCKYFCNQGEGTLFYYDIHLCNWVLYPHTDNKKRKITIDQYINIKQNDILTDLSEIIKKEFNYEDGNKLDECVSMLNNIRDIHK